MKNIANLKKIIFVFIFYAGFVNAEVIDSSSYGFTVKSSVNISAPSEQVYKNLINPRDWWDSEHTYSGNSANLLLEDKAGGCFCEKFDQQSVQHMVVVYSNPGNTLRLRGSLGPLQEMGVTGSLTFNLTKSGNDTILELTYAVGGYKPDGFQELAGIVDFVLSHQLTRLKNFTEKGKPE